MNLRILALDPSVTCTGWAACDEAGNVTSGRQGFPVERGESVGFRYHRFRAWLENLVIRHAPQIVVYEHPLVMHRGSQAAEAAFGLTTRIQEVAAERDIDYRGLHNSTLKLWAAGNGKATKEQMQAAAAARFPFYVPEHDPGSDEADALCLLAWALSGFPEPARRPRKPKARKPKPQPTLGLGR